MHKETKKQLLRFTALVYGILAMGTVVIGLGVGRLAGLDLRDTLYATGIKLLTELLCTAVAFWVVAW